MRAQRRRAEQTEEELLKVQNCVLFGRSQQCLTAPPPANTSSALGTLSHTRADACAQKHTHNTGGTHRSYFAPQTGKHMKHTSYTQGHAKRCKAPSSVHTSGNAHTHRRHAQTSHCNIQKHLTCTPRHTQWTQQPRDPTATPRNTHLYTETQPGMQCFTQVHSSETHMYTHR